MERLGIFGGTFSPPHLGHVHAAKAFLKEIRLDKLLIIPTYVPPHKVRTEQTSADDRLQMCRLAFDFSPKLEVSDIEIRRQGRSYTANTLKALEKEGSTLFFLCGTDMFLTLDSWYMPETIFSLAQIVCMEREEDTEMEQEILAKKREYETRFDATVHRLSSPSFPMSSTRIRKAIASAQPWEDFVSRGVRDYIVERGLYL